MLTKLIVIDNQLEQMSVPLQVKKTRGLLVILKIKTIPLQAIFWKKF